MLGKGIRTNSADTPFEPAENTWPKTRRQPRRTNITLLDSQEIRTSGAYVPYPSPAVSGVLTILMVTNLACYTGRNRHDSFVPFAPCFVTSVRLGM